VSSGIPYYPQQLAGFKIKNRLISRETITLIDKITYIALLVQIDKINMMGKKK